MYICICNAVTDKDIRKAAESGVRSMRQLRQATGCAGNCGQCAPMAKQILEANQLQGTSLFPPILEPSPA